MNIVHLIPALRRGGTERIVLHLSREQMKHGHNVKIFSFSNVNEYTSGLNGLDIEFFPNSSAYHKVIGKPQHNLDKFEDNITRFCPDVIHSHSYWTDTIINAIKPLSAVYFSHLHLYYKEYIIHLRPNLKSVIRYIGFISFLKEFKKRNTYFIATSNAIKNYYKELLPRSFTKKIELIPNFLAFEPQKKIKTLNPQAPCKLLSVGRLVTLKNHEALIEICKILKSKGFKFQLKIAGEGPLKSALESKIQSDGLQNEIQLLGNVENIKALYEESDIYLHSSYEEAFGLVVLEAMAHGLPSIVNEKAKGLDDIITDSSMGLKTSMADLNEVAQLIISLAENKKTYEDMSVAALQQSRNFSIESYWKQLEKLYRR